MGSTATPYPTLLASVRMEANMCSICHGSVGESCEGHPIPADVSANDRSRQLTMTAQLRH
jgi:hypothetical protein